MTPPERPKQSHTAESGRGRKRGKDCEVLQAYLSQLLLSRVKFLLYALEGCTANRSARPLTTIEQLPQHYDGFVLSLLSFSQHNVSASTSPRRL
jgi:ribosomal protein S14